MRELLFRGRFKANKFRWNGTPREYEFVESKTHHISVIHFNNNGDISHVVIPYKDTCITLFPEYFTTFDIQQYTGVEDKNGTKIFEGDIIVMDEYPFYDNGILSYVGEVVWFENTFSFGIILNCVDKNRVGISNGVSEDIEDDMVFEVIGNIHDNPDLIK